MRAPRVSARCTGCTSVAEARDDAQEVQVSREHMDVRSDRPRATSGRALGRPFFSSIFFRRVKKMDPRRAGGSALILSRIAAGESF